jgi:tRNA (cmo5U34)-methyltransferase
MTTATRNDVVWQKSALAKNFLENVRAGIPYGVDQLEIMLRLTRARGEDVQTFMDLGCGGGALARAVLSEYPNGHGTLVDFSEPMLEAAHTQLDGYGDQLQFVQADLSGPEWKSGFETGFDVIVSGYAIHHLAHERKRALYQEIFDLLNPNGMFVNVEHVSSSTAWGEAQFDELMIDSLLAHHTAHSSGKTRDQIRDELVKRPDKVANILAPLETQLNWLREIGFQDVDCYFKVFELAVFAGRKV